MKIKYRFLLFFAASIRPTLSIKRRSRRNINIEFVMEISVTDIYINVKVGLCDIRIYYYKVHGQTFTGMHLNRVWSPNAFNAFIRDFLEYKPNKYIFGIEPKSSVIMSTVNGNVYFSMDDGTRTVETMVSMERQALHAKLIELKNIIDAA